MNLHVGQVGYLDRQTLDFIAVASLVKRNLAGWLAGLSHGVFFFCQEKMTLEALNVQLGIM